MTKEYKNNQLLDAMRLLPSFILDEDVDVRGSHPHPHF